MTKPQTRVYRDGVLEAEGFPVSDVSDHLEHDRTIVWVDLCGPSIEQLHELAEELGLHELAVEGPRSATTSAPRSTTTPATCSSRPMQLRSIERGGDSSRWKSARSSATGG